MLYLILQKPFDINFVKKSDKIIVLLVIIIKIFIN
jgi:hypothetical protein